MAFTVVAEAGVEIVPVKDRDFNARLKAAVGSVRKSLTQLKAGIDGRSLVHDLTKASRSAARQVPALKLEAELSKASVARIRAQMAGLARDTARVRIEIDAPRAVVHASTDASAARRELDRVARVRRARIKVDVDGAGLRAARGALDGLSRPVRRATGIDGLRKQLDGLFSTLEPGKIARIGLLSAALSVTGSGGAVLAGNVLTVAASLGQLGGLAGPVPGLLAAVKVGAQTLAWAFQDVAVQAPELVEAWKGLKVAVSDGFWSTARGPILEMADELMPRLTRAWSDTAGAMGTEAGHLADALRGALSGDWIERFFGYITDGARALRPAFEPVTQALADLVDFGASQLPKLAGWAADVASRASGALSGAVDDGTLQRMLDTGLVALQDLWRAADGLFGAIGGIAKAAADAGSSTLSVLADGLQQLDATINSPAFQEGLSGAFVAARETWGAFIAEAGPGLQDLVLGLLDTFREVGPLLGEGLGTVVGALGSMLGSGDVQAGLQSLLGSVADVATQVGPVLAQMAPSLGDILTLMGGLATGVLPVLAQGFADILPLLLPVLEQFAGLALQLAPVLVDGLTLIAGALGEVFADPAVAQALSDAVAALGQAVIELAPHLPGLVSAFIELLPAAVEFGRFALDVIVPALGFLMDNIEIILPLIAGIGTAFELAGVAAGLGLALSGPVGWAIGAIGLLVAAIVGIGTHWDEVKATVSAVLDWFRDVFSALGDWFGGLWAGITEGIKTAFSSVGEWLANLWGSIQQGLGDLVKNVPLLGKLIDLVDGDDSGGGFSGGGGGFGDGFGGAPGGAWGGGGTVNQNITIHNPQVQSASQDMARGAREAAVYGGSF
ncbi:hypothetical protein LG274_02705 [Micrococcus antarcticus]|uniref:phage tail protein n=1 Tax=Micrococcus antarcticus TaxID=86171 RepID=UPI00384C117F